MDEPAGIKDNSAIAEGSKIEDINLSSGDRNR